MKSNKQGSPLGFNPMEQRRQLELRQQQQQQQHQQHRLRQLQIQRKGQLIQQQKQIQQAQNVQQEMMQKQRQQLRAMKQQQNVKTLHAALWNSTVYKNTPKNLQSSGGVISQSASPGRLTFNSYPKTPQVSYGRHSPQWPLQNNSGDKNVATQNNPDLISRSMVSPKQTYFVQSSRSQSQVVGENNIPATERNKPGMNVTNRSGITPSSSGWNQLQLRNQVAAPLKPEPPPIMLTKTPETQGKQFPVNSVSYVFQKQKESPSSFNPNPLVNTTAKVERRGNMEDIDGRKIQSQEKPTKKEKLFYFPIKRDTLIQMLPTNLLKKYSQLSGKEGHQ